MILITTPVKWYGRKIVTDLVLRSGSSNVSDFSPYEGKNGIVENFGKEETSADLEYLFEAQKDFDADIIQPHRTEEEYNKIEERDEYERGMSYVPSKDYTTFDDYFRRLEDICVDYLEDYIANLCYTVFKLTGSGGVKKYNYDHYEQPTLVSIDDDSVTELADLQLRTDTESYSSSMKAAAMENMPYVLKRIDNLSRYCGVHMISMIAAYLKAKAANARRVSAGVTKSMLKKNDVIALGVYKYDYDGQVGMRIEVTNKNRRAADMFDWIVGANDMYPSYREDLVNFIQYCNILNIDLESDNLLQYDGKFMDNLTVLTLTPNTQYCQAVFDAIRDSGMFKKEPSVDELLLTTLNCFADLCTTQSDLLSAASTHDSLKSERCMKMAMQLHYIWAVKLRNPVMLPDDRLYSWRDGFLAYNGELVMLPTRVVSKQQFTTPVCIISELGYVLHLNNTMYVEAMTIDCAVENMHNAYISPDPDFVPTDWMWFQ